MKFRAPFFSLPFCRQVAATLRSLLHKTSRRNFVIFLHLISPRFFYRFFLVAPSITNWRANPLRVTRFYAKFLPSRDTATSTKYIARVTCNLHNATSTLLRCTERYLYTRRTVSYRGSLDYRARGLNGTSDNGEFEELKLSRKYR